jgi:peptide/nickel transport system permease protein
VGIYLFRRLVYLALTLFVSSAIIFLITRWLPGDVCRVILGREAGSEAVAACRLELGLDDPLPVQYARWAVSFVQGDWGASFSARAPIFPLLVQRTRNSLMLAAVTLVISVPISIALGFLAAVKENRTADHLISVLSLSVVGLPEFITGLVLIQLFAFQFRRWGLPYLPANSSIQPQSGFWEALPALILPALTAALVLLAYITRMTRAGVLEELKKPYVRAANLKGLQPGRILFRHVLPNALLPAITVIAISVGWLLSGLAVTENVFNYPGLGRLLVFAIDRRDLPLIQAIAVVSVFLFAAANLAADLLYALMNPRIRYGTEN